MSKDLIFGHVHGEGKRITMNLVEHRVVMDTTGRVMVRHLARSIGEVTPVKVKHDLTIISTRPSNKTSAPKGMTCRYCS